MSIGKNVTCEGCGQFFYLREGDDKRKKKCLRCDPPKHAQVERGHVTDFHEEAIRNREKALLRAKREELASRKGKNK